MERAGAFTLRGNAANTNTHCLHIGVKKPDLLCKKYLPRPGPLQALDITSSNIRSFTGNVFTDHILHRNSLCKPCPLQEQFLQTESFTGTIFSNHVRSRTSFFSHRFLYRTCLHKKFACEQHRFHIQKDCFTLYKC